MNYQSGPLSRTDNASQSELDATEQQNQAKLQRLITAVGQGYRPTQQEVALISAYKKYDPTMNKISDYGWWHTWGPIVMATAGMAAGGITSGLGGLSGVAGGTPSLVPGLIDTAMANSPMLATIPAATTALAALQPGEGMGSPGKIGVPDSLSNAGLSPSSTSASGLPSWVKPVTALGTIAAPPIVRGLTGGDGGSSPNGTGNNGLNPDQTSQINQLMQLLIDHANRSAPVHQAAMNLALRMAPQPNSSPQMQAALAASTTPRPQTQTDPQVLDAIQRLMSGGR